MENYLHLQPYSEARDALAALEGRKLAVFSNGSPKMLPHPSCYALVEPVLGRSEGGRALRLVERL